MINSMLYEYKQFLCSNCSMAEMPQCFPEKSSWCGKEHICQGVKCEALLVLEVLRTGYRAIDLIRLPAKAKAQIPESNICFHLCVIRPPEICVNLVFKHIHATSIYTTNSPIWPPEMKFNIWIW